MMLEHYSVGTRVVVNKNPIHPKLAGLTGTVVKTTDGGERCTNKDPQRRDQSCRGNVIVQVPGRGKFLLRPEHVEVIP